ncbi:OBAP family protein [Cellulomonas sp. PhB143]|uniref:OBAP family protein n=1 Tax=Cellulomonas sp. PhB143 TaxID=2485186 RepID=UPI000F467387|nr:OBAP family protein [Cellulomonas sp. PhB143]ROS73312.1 uncharacterized protein DUF1264 [Cellulomonas sp. PhB143]
MRNPTISERRTGTTAAGAPTSVPLRVLDEGARLLQSGGPLPGFDVYVVGFHCAKGEPDFQMEAHHFCRVVNDDLLQCVLFDGNTRDANLIGVEYIVSGRLHATLDPAEQAYWHPHNFEVLSGQLAAPGLPERVERELMARLLNSYGKTWHTWHTSTGAPDAGLPLGDPKLMWSFNREGECDEALIRDRNEAMGLDTAGRRESRRTLEPDAEPQHGVDAMRDDFPGSVPVPGVRDADAGSPDTGGPDSDDERA